MKKTLFNLLILISATTFGQKKYQNQKGGSEMRVEFMGESKRLDAITPVAYRAMTNTEDVYVVPNKLSKIDQFKLGPNSAPDPVMQKSSFETLETQGGGQVIQGFDGGSNADNAAFNGVRITPPDTQGDVGPNHYVQMVNLLTTIYDKQGNTLLGPIPSNLFFQDLDDRLSMSNNGDPVVLYDQFADRWIISQFSVDSAPFAMLIAVSTTPDPLGTYNQYAIFYGDDFPDYPKLGIWNDGLYITTRDFNGNNFIGFSIVAVNKDDIVNGVAEPRSQRFQILNPGFDGILPADADGDLMPPAGQAHPSMFMGGANELNLVLTSVDFDNPDNSTMTFDTVPVAPFNVFSGSVPQPNGELLDALPNFLMYRLQYRNFGTHASITTNHSVQEVPGGPFGVRWYEFRDTGASTWDVFQQGTFMPDDGLNRWMGSIAMNGDGDIALGYSVSGVDLAPSIRFAGQSASESGSGILNIPEASILEGTASITGATRWGDYAMMSVDPVDEDFWFTTEYVDGDDSGAFPWATFISEMTFGDPPTAVCQDITVEFDATDGSVSITPEQIDNGSIGPDGSEVTLSLDIDTFDCSNIGENTVTLTATSSEGISASCTATVTVNVIDSEAPVAVCQDVIVELGLDGSIEITADQIDGGSTDNCAIASLVVDQSVFTEQGTFNVTLTVTDFAGLTDTCEAIVTVAEGAEIVVDPLSISAAVDETDIPPVATETFSITNNGDVPLDFTTEVGVIETVSEEMTSALANLDRSIYSNVNNKFSIGGFKSVTAVKKESEFKIIKPELANSTQVVDSLFYDSGIDFPSSFGGLDDGIALSAGVLFVVDSEGFTLTSVRNAYATEAVQGANILLQVYAGGVTPDQGELIFEQIVTGDSETGVFALETLTSPLTFTQGESFWVVHSYPEGINFPQGQDGGVTNTVPGVYSFSQDGGQTFTLIDGFAFLTRALNEGVDGGSVITLSPENGVVQPGESIEVSVAFNGETLANGTYNSDLTIMSNDRLTPTVTIPTTFNVSGQTSTIEVSDELLLFNDVFIGNSAERSLIISNTGTNLLTISSITSDNAEFIVTPSSTTVAAGEELEVLVTYTPEGFGSSNGILTITSDAANASSVRVVVNGVGVEGPFAVLDPLQNLVTLQQGESTNVDITLSNNGGSPLIYSFPEFTVAAAMANGTELYKAEVIDFSNFSAAQSKGFEDTRKGAPVPFSMGTDLVFGYTWIDSDEEGGPVPNFIDIIPFGATDLTEFLNDGNFADGTVEITLPSPIPLYGENQESLFINANGFVSFEEPTGVTFVNGQIPVDDGINNIIAPFWSDLEPGVGEGGTVHIAAFDEATIIQWTDAPGFLTTGTVTFQVVIFADGTIDVQYEDVSTASFLANATVGIENSNGTDGTQVAFNTDFVKDNFAVRFIPPAVPGANFITAVTPISGVLGAGQQEIITVTVDSQGLNLGTFLDELLLSSNTVNLDSSTANFELTVVGVPEPELTFVLINADTDEAIGPLVDGTIIDLGDFSANSFNVIAVPSDNITIGSVIFDFNDVIGFRTESIAPYTLNGDEAGDFNPVEFLTGTNTITATPFSGASASGSAGIPLTVTFEVVNVPNSDITSFTLINADVNEEIGPLNEGAVIDLADFNTNSFSVTANIEDDASVGSVIFDFNDVVGFQTESIAPYTLDGDTNGDFNPVEFPIGTNTITATPFSGASGSGSAGTPLTVTFEVVDIEVVDSPDNFGGFIYPNPVDDVTYFTLEDKSAKVLIGTIQGLYGGVINQRFKLVTDKLGNGNIDMSTLPKGLYILQLKDEKGVLVSQLKIAKN